MDKILTFGVFDYFHIGHLRLFKQCKKYADYLIVAVQNGSHILDNKPDAHVMYTTEERIEMVEAMRLVDEVITYDTVSPEILKFIEFDILALGEDQQGTRFDCAEDWCKKQGKKVIRLRRTPNICSSQIKRKISEN